MPRNGKTTGSDISGQLSALPMRLRVCLMTANLWGLPTASNTATAFGLLAGALGADPSLEVHFPHPKQLQRPRSRGFSKVPK